MPAAERKIETVRFAAVEFHAVYAAYEIDIRDVAVLRASAFHGNFARVSFQHFFEFGFYVGVFNIIRVALNFHTFVRSDLHFGLHGNGGCHHHFIFGKFVHRYVGIAHRGEFFRFFGKDISVVIGKEDIQPFFIEYALAVRMLDHVLGGFALTEPVYRESAAFFDVRFILRFDPFVLIERHLDLNGAFFCCFGSILHNEFSPDDRLACP